MSLYDTLDHQIGGVQQQQGGYAGSLSFSSQFGTFSVESLPFAPEGRPQSGGSQREPYAPATQNPPQQPFYPPEPQQPSYAQSSGGPQSHDEILSALERLGTLHQKGVLSDDEFRSKKAELLARL